jgi:hypothetical protein
LVPLPLLAWTTGLEHWLLAAAAGGLWCSASVVLCGRLLTALLSAPPPLHRRTFSVDWQPSGITWYVDDWVTEEKSPAPSKPMHTVLSIWARQSAGRLAAAPGAWRRGQDAAGALTDPTCCPSDWGGFVPWDHEPYHAYFTKVNRLVCDLPAPKVRSWRCHHGGVLAAGARRLVACPSPLEHGISFFGSAIKPRRQWRAPNSC